MYASSLRSETMVFAKSAVTSRSLVHASFSKYSPALVLANEVKAGRKTLESSFRLPITANCLTS